MKEIVYTLQEEGSWIYDYNWSGCLYHYQAHAPGKTSVTFTKWDDRMTGWDSSKSIQVQLYANDQKVGQEVELSAENKWTHTFADLE